MERNQIMQEIALLDKKIHEVSARGRVGRLEARSFPTTTIIACVVCLGYFVFGDLIEQQFYPMARWVALGLGALLGLSAVVGIFKLLASKMKGKGGLSDNNVAELQNLQERKAMLQKQLDATK